MTTNTPKPEWFEMADADNVAFGAHRSARAGITRRGRLVALSAPLLLVATGFMYAQASDQGPASASEVASASSLNQSAPAEDQGSPAVDQGSPAVNQSAPASSQSLSTSSAPKQVAPQQATVTSLTNSLPKPTVSAASMGDDDEGDDDGDDDEGDDDGDDDEGDDDEGDDD